MNTGRDITDRLTQEEQAAIEAEFGPQPCFGHALFSKETLESVHELTSTEAWFFDPGTFMSEHCAMQTLFKFRGTITTLQFNRALRMLIERDSSLRSGFIRLPDRVVRIAFPAERYTDDVFYRNLSGQLKGEMGYTLNSYMNADVRRGFDISRGPLFRFAIFRTGTEEYAVLLTILGLVKSRLDMRQLFEAMEMRTISGPPAEASFTEEGAYVAEPIRQYWGKILADLPPRPELPFCNKDTGRPFSQRAYRMAVPEEMTLLLRQKSEGNQNMLMCILQTVWGLFLQHTNACDDTYCCMLMPVDEKKSAPGGLKQTVMPVRLRTEASQTVREVITGQFRQLLASRPFSCFDKKGLSDLLGNHRELFSHYLSFGSFGRQESSYADAQASREGTPVAENVWDAQGMPLGVYFFSNASGISLNFLYDAARFSAEGIEKIAQAFRVTLVNVFNSWDDTMDLFRLKLAKMMDSSSRVSAVVLRLPAETLLKRHAFFEGVRDSSLHKLAMSTKRVTRFEGDYFPVYGKTPLLYFLAEGQVVRYIKGSSGWLNLLDLKGKGSWLNETVFLPKCKSELTAEVLSEEAQLLTIPMDAFENLLSEEPFLMRRMFLHTLKEMEKYQRSWIET